jgi:Asp-tRNA(Asn)/Glu-tRNA(Gln) amidotransferase A subunit family amidase
MLSGMWPVTAASACACSALVWFNAAMAGAELTDWSARELATAIGRRDVSAVEVVEAHLGRIDRQTTNAVVTIVDDARAAAERADEVLAWGESRGALHGVPFTAKDVLDTAGTRTTAGSELFRDYVPAHDATAVAALRAAGAILVGKTNCPEFALEPRATNPVFGATTSPFDPTLGPGGSSGGCAAAVAGGLTPLSLGTDYGGSVRFPAHCTGTFGLRPTPGRIATGGQRPSPPAGTPRARFSLVGPLARTADDLRLALEVLGGPSTAPVASAAPLPCAWAAGEGTVVVPPDLVAAVERAATALVERGHDVVEVAPPGLERAHPLFGELRTTDDYADLVALAGGRTRLLTPRICSLLADAPPRPDLDRRAELLVEVDRLRSEVGAFLASRPILLLPVAAVPSFPLGCVELEVAGTRHVVDAMTILAPCRAVSLLGLPAASVPAGVSDGGLPVGVQVVGRAGHDHDVLAVAAELEAALGGWLPPPHAAASTSRTLHGAPHSSTS